MSPRLIIALAVAAVFAALSGGLLYYRAQAAKAEVTIAEYRHAYELLAQSAQRQAQAMSELEAAAAAAAEKGARARREAAVAVDVAKRSADALTRALRGPRPTGDCPERSAVEAIREDLARSE